MLILYVRLESRKNDKKVAKNCTPLFLKVLRQTKQIMDFWTALTGARGLIGQEYDFQKAKKPTMMPNTYLYNTMVKQTHAPRKAYTYTSCASNARFICIYSRYYKIIHTKYELMTIHINQNKNIRRPEKVEHTKNYYLQSI